MARCHLKWHSDHQKIGVVSEPGWVWERNYHAQIEGRVLTSFCAVDNRSPINRFQDREPAQIYHHNVKI